MSKISEYIALVKKQRVARNEMRAAEAKITVYHKTYVLDIHEDAEEAACINKCERVQGKALNVSDDGGFVKFCYLFSELPCTDRKCPFFAKNLDYTVAKERYEMACNARHAFVRGLFKGRTK
jgi:hypothetical protein